jgi:hypothetical protein
VNKEQRESYLVDVLILRKRGMGVEAISEALGVHKRQGKRWADMLRARGQWPALSDGQITELCRRETDGNGRWVRTGFAQSRAVSNFNISTHPYWPDV